MLTDPNEIRLKITFNDLDEYNDLILLIKKGFKLDRTSIVREDLTNEYKYFTIIHLKEIK